MILIKIGGGKNIRLDYIVEDVKKYLKTEPVVIVHGASELRDTIGNKMGVTTQTVTSPSGISSVYTNQEALDVFLMAYAGVANKRIVSEFIRRGVPAIGLTGVDGNLWLAKEKPNLMVQTGDKVRLIRDNLTGRVEKVNAELLLTVIKQGYVPVLTAPAITEKGVIVNTDNDWAAAMTAGALHIKRMVYLFEAKGLLKDFTKPDSLIRHIDKKQIQDYLPYAHGRMKKKMLGAQEAIRQGVSEIYFGDGTITSPVYSALGGKGTVLS